MRPLVIVRPEPGASATAEAARTAGLEAIALPLFEVCAFNWEAPNSDGFDALLFTSANALRWGGPELDKLKQLPAHCVGEATAEAARDSGFLVASVGKGGVNELLQSLPPLKLLHICGTARKSPAGGRQIEAVPVYESLEIDQDFDAIGGAVVALHSPRAAAAFARRVTSGREGIAIAAISAETADAAGPGWEQVEAATAPTDSALLAIASWLCNNRR